MPMVLIRIIFLKCKAFINEQNQFSVNDVNVNIHCHGDVKRSQTEPIFDVLTLPWERIDGIGISNFYLLYKFVVNVIGQHHS